MISNLIFSDGLKTLSFDKGLIKMVFFSNEEDDSSEKENAQLQINSGKVIMPVESFADFYNALTNLAETLEERKIIEKGASIEANKKASEDYLRPS